MQIRLYKALPEHLGSAVQPPDCDETGQPLLTTVCLERDSDPHANNHTGYDFWGASAETDDLFKGWEEKNQEVLIPIDYSKLPNPVTFYPEIVSGKVKVRARDETGKFISDDPYTPDINEAWVEVTL